jgi:hypothetical protein
MRFLQGNYVEYSSDFRSFRGDRQARHPLFAASSAAGSAIETAGLTMGPDEPVPFPKYCGPYHVCTGVVGHATWSACRQPVAARRMIDDHHQLQHQQERERGSGLLLSHLTAGSENQTSILFTASCQARVTSR